MAGNLVAEQLFDSELPAELNNTDEVAISTDFNPIEDEYLDDADSASCSNATRSGRRQMPFRASKENSQLKIKRRSIMKPKKRKECDFSSLRPADIKKIYLSKKITNFRPSNLETIFEEPQLPKSTDGGNEVDSDGGSSHVRFIGIKKIRRSLSCSDGLNVGKTLMKQRRAKIKKTFGSRFALKKISLDDFLERLKKNIDE